MKSFSFAVATIVTAIAVQPCQGQTSRANPADAQQRWAEDQELMSASDPILRWEGLNRALSDENPGIRNNALWAYLNKRDSLPLEIVLPPGSRLGSGDLPNLDVTEIKWNENQRAMVGIVISFGSRFSMTGQVAGGRLRLRYQLISMPSYLGLMESANPSQQPTAIRSCSTVLSVNESRDGLEGTLTCEGLSLALPLRTPLG